MKAVFCFILKAGHRLKAATVYSRWSELEQRELFTLITKWAGSSGGINIPISSIEKAGEYVKRYAQP